MPPADRARIDAIDRELAALKARYHAEDLPVAGLVEAARALIAERADLTSDMPAAGSTREPLPYARLARGVMTFCAAYLATDRES